MMKGFVLVKIIVNANLFHATGLFPCLLKTSENQKDKGIESDQ